MKKNASCIRSTMIEIKRENRIHASTLAWLGMRVFEKEDTGRWPLMYRKAEQRFNKNSQWMLRSHRRSRPDGSSVLWTSDRFARETEFEWSKSKATDWFEWNAVSETFTFCTSSSNAICTPSRVRADASMKSIECLRANRAPSSRVTSRLSSWSILFPTSIFTTFILVENVSSSEIHLDGDNRSYDVMTVIDQLIKCSPVQLTKRIPTANIINQYSTLRTPVRTNDYDKRRNKSSFTDNLKQRMDQCRDYPGILTTRGQCAKTFLSGSILETKKWVTHGPLSSRFLERRLPHCNKYSVWSMAILSSHSF